MYQVISAESWFQIYIISYFFLNPVHMVRVAKLLHLVEPSDQAVKSYNYVALSLSFTFYDLHIL